MPAPTTNYQAAAVRHFSDGNALADTRLPLADHALGVAAECALKTILVGLGAPTNAHGTLLLATKQNKGHLPGILNEFRIYAGNPYATDLPSPASGAADLFESWSIHERYSDGQHIDAARLEQHKKDVAAVFAVLQKAQEEGIVV